MTQEEFTQLVESMKAQGATDEDILGALLEMFKSGKVAGEDLEKLAGSLGYELTEEFKDSLAAKTDEAEDEPAEAEEVSEEEVEDAQETEPGESDESDEDEDDEDSEEDEKKKARELYGLDD